jgi:OmpA-OmpF porin, OOP family
LERHGLKLSPLLLIASLAWITLHTQAAEPYVGLSLATPGEASIGHGGKTLNNLNNPTALKLYGGVALGDGWSLEAGYGAFGSWRFSDPSSTPRFEARMASRAVTAAARYSVDLGDSVAVFGKVGLAANRLRYSDSSGQSARDGFVRPMWGFGAELKLGDHLSVPLEFEHLGASNTRFGKYRQQKLELGLRYKF